ncbi:MAG: peptidoglycan D,D-transpeptidase FtsI family protein [bacterium]
MGVRFTKQRKNTRLHFIFGIFILSYLILVARLFNLQIIQCDELTERMHKRTTPSRTNTTSLRGSIYDRNGEELAVSLKRPSAYVHPHKVKDKKKFMYQLASFPGIDISRIKTFFKQGKPFIWIKRKLTPLEEKILGDLGLEDIHYYIETKRFYPHTSLASQVIGFAGMDGKGLEGLEFYFDSLLKGKDKGRANFILTIDRVIQYFADEALRDRCIELGAKMGMLVMMEVNTGEIWALSNWPSFNPNIFNKYKRENWRIRCIADSFEPGSIIKVFGAAAVIEENLGKPEDIIDCQQGSIRIAGCTIRDYKKFGKLSLSEVIECSSNVGAIKMVQRLGEEKYYHYLKEFGFGEKTAITLPAEASGIFKPPEYWSGISLASLAIGQEISVTSIQFITAFSSLINGGYRVKPRIVKRMCDQEGASIKAEITRSKQGEQIISEGTSTIIRDMLQRVVSHGTGKLAAINNYNIGGKTGTAQKIDPKTCTYSHEDYVASFVGFFPGKNPRWAMIVVIDEPQKDKAWGGQAAAPVFQKVAEQSMEYLNIWPDEII